MQAYQQRVIDEKNELQSKTEKLAAFLNDIEKVSKLDKIPIRLLHIQYHAMQVYLITLEQRIELFE